MSNSEFLKVDIRHNIFHILGDLRLSTLGNLSSALYQSINRAGYRDITLDFSHLTTITASVIPPLASYLRHLVREYNVDFDFVEPRSNHVKSRILNLGLAHYICHRKYPKPRLKSSDPALIQFLNHDEREIATDKVINSALRTAKLSRKHMAALEWAVNEITDNVLTHAKSKVGGFLISQKLSNTNIIEFTVADCGIGIARSLGLHDETEAVEKAIQEGVTRNKSTDQGNGLFGTYRLSLASAGVFILKSRHANLYVTKSGEIHVRNEAIPFNGTFVVCQIDCDNPDLVERAFVFGGKAHLPAYDYVERIHEDDSSDITILATDICKTFGSRQSGLEARRYLTNIMTGSDFNTLKIDFTGVNVVSSSYADEVFGKLFVELGPIRFMRSIKIINAASVVESLIDRAITLRTQTGL